MDHRNIVREIFFSDIEDVMLGKKLFKPIRLINCTNSEPIWTPTCEDSGHYVKSTSFTPPKKKEIPKCTIFMCKMVRKDGKIRDFTKLHAEPKN